MQVLSVASEVHPLVKTGGLADVAGALPKALAAEGVEMRTILPRYPVLGGIEGREVAALDGPGGPARLLAAEAAGLSLYLLDAPQLYDRPGGPYQRPDGADHADNHLRFGALAHAAARIGAGADPGWRPAVLHGHDWQAGLAPLYARAAGGPPAVMTIHNVAFQGRFGRDAIGPLGLPPERFTPGGYEFWGDVSFLKAGLAEAAKLTTVSPTYAEELLTPEFGEGLDGLLRARAADFSGVLNGIDDEAWNPETDPALAARYSAKAPAGKAVCKAALEAETGLEAAGGPLFAVISRLTGQKGLDLLLAALPAALARGARLALLGSGEPRFEAAFRELAARRPGRVAARIGYDEGFAHRMQAGADALLVPSRFEPCGLTQLCALRYGTLPVVARTGGLADTVIDLNPAARAAGAGTGFLHAPGSAAALAAALGRAIDLFADRRAWAAAMRRAMRQPVGWGPSAAAYARLYRSLA